MGGRQFRQAEMGVRQIRRSREKIGRPPKSAADFLNFFLPLPPGAATYFLTHENFRIRKNNLLLLVPHLRRRRRRTRNETHAHHSLRLQRHRYSPLNTTDFSSSHPQPNAARLADRHASPKTPPILAPEHGLGVVGAPATKRRQKRREPTTTKTCSSEANKSSSQRAKSQ